MTLFSGPPGPVAVPEAVAAQTRGRTLRPVWRNERGGLTFAFDAHGQRHFLKWAPAGSGLDLTQETDRLLWARHHTPVPPVLARGADATGSWFITRGLPGDNAVTDRCKADPATAVRAVGRALRALHERLPVAQCPFSWSVSTRVAAARAAQTLTAAHAAALWAQAPPVLDPVVCHGDACLPNTLITHDGAWSGHVDLGALGVADRWADLAVATWSTQVNYGPGWEQPLLDAYQIAPDHARIAYYRQLWDAT